MAEPSATPTFQFSGNGKFKREDSVIMFNSKLNSADENGLVFDEENPAWLPIGEDNDELTRETNNESDSKKNVLGRVNIDSTKGAETMEVDPIAIRANDTLSYILYMAYKYGLVGDKVRMQFLDVTYADKQGEKTYGAFIEHGIPDLTSWGGDTSKLSSPMKINFENDKVHGTFSTTNNTFTETTIA